MKHAHFFVYAVANLMQHTWFTSRTASFMA